jgi:integrase
MVHGRERFMVDSRRVGFPSSKRSFYSSLSEATVCAEKLEIELLNHGTRAFGELSLLQRKDALEAFQVLAPLPGTCLVKAALAYIEAHHAAAKRAAGPLVKDALEAFLEAKRAEHKAGTLRKLSLYDLQTKTRYLAVELGEQRVSEIDARTMEEFLAKLTLSPRARENVRLKSSQFFNFCIRRKWMTENPAFGLGKKIDSTEVEILSVDAARQLLAAAQISPLAASVIPYLCVSLFAGLRPGEAEQLKWEQIHFATDQIEVLKGTSKTKETRFVTLSPFLAEWLLPFRKSRGPIVGANLIKDWKDVRNSAGYNHESKPWPVDVLRHTFGSYWLAIHQDRARLGEEMGNSVDVIKRFYSRAIHQQQAQEFWRLQPDPQLGNVLPFRQAAG